MKVAILSFYSGLVSRGVETFVRELFNRVKDRAELKIYQADKMPVAGNKLAYLFLDSPSLAIRQFTREILAKLALDPPDIIMALNNGWMSLLAKQFCRRHKTKLVLAGFSGIGWDDKVNLWFKPDCFVACSHWQEQWAKQINPHVRIETINIGVNTDRFRPQGEKYNHGLKPPVVLVVAGPQSWKRVDLAIKAVAGLGQASLLVVGEQGPKVKLLGERLLGKRFKNIQVDYQQLDAVYRSAAFYTLPSGSSEAYGISILEALASGLPVVVNDDPIRRELVGRVGILTDPTDLPQYILALRQALSQPKIDYRQQALKFSWDKISQQYINLWSSLL